LEVDMDASSLLISGSIIGLLVADGNAGVPTSILPRVDEVIGLDRSSSVVYRGYRFRCRHRWRWKFGVVAG
jgi:hypothetical protein